MKVLTIGTDKDLLREGSVSAERHKAYARTFEHLHAVVFARAPKYPRETISLAENLTVYATGSSSTLGLFIDAYRSGKHILEEEGEWVISAQDPFESGLVAYLLSRATGVPFLLQEHGDFFSKPYYWRRESLMNGLRFVLGRWLLRRASHVRVVSERIKRALLVQGIPEERITVLPVYIDRKVFDSARPAEGIVALRPKDGVLVVTMARMVPQKNLHLLITAFKEVLARGVQARLLIVGDGSEKYALLASAQEYLPHGITFLAWSHDPASVLKATDIYVVSSDYEGWGRVCIEALTAGTPLIMTEVGCAGEVVRDGENGLVVPVRDAPALTEAIVRLAQDATLRAKLAQNGISTAHALPSDEEYIERYCACLASCLSTPHD
jgi:glycosyltransferase involved in cell wall biosynthesis